ncbi:MAG TPA: restriction endonuclease [Pyrinomonadaceae bacterium]|nr:restriction endonuclease [Pyrinomonadaceae bacterium]
MIINQNDIEELDRYLEDFRAFETGEGWSPDEPSVSFFGERPHLLLPLGFDQSRFILPPKDVDTSDPNSSFEADLAKTAEALYGIPGMDFTFGVEWLYSQSRKGAWYWFEGLDSNHLLFRGPAADPKLQFSVDDLYRSLRRLTVSPDSGSHTLWLPGLWTPKFQNDTRQFLDQQVSALLQEIYKEGKALSEIRPRQLEELIAELLRDHGMAIHITPQTRDGGRDVIARGEFVPGEPMILAVEVKQKPVVGIQDLYNSLKANEDYPALLLATSGRFSAGVIQEKKRRRNELRLILKDGVALSQWIAMYGAKRST